MPLHTRLPSGNVQQHTHRAVKPVFTRSSLGCLQAAPGLWISRFSQIVTHWVRLSSLGKKSLFVDMSTFYSASWGDEVSPSGISWEIMPCVSQRTLVFQCCVSSLAWDALPQIPHLPNWGTFTSNHNFFLTPNVSRHKQILPLPNSTLSLWYLPGSGNPKSLHSEQLPTWVGKRPSSPRVQGHNQLLQLGLADYLMDLKLYISLQKRVLGLAHSFFKCLLQKKKNPHSSICFKIKGENCHRTFN